MHINRFYDECGKEINSNNHIAYNVATLKLY